MRLSSRFLSFLLLLFVLAGISATTFAAIHTSAVPKARVTSRVDSSKRTTLHGHVPAAVRHGMDMGRVDPNTKVEHLIMVLKSDEEQKREIRRIIDEQQDKRTANYHQWVTPEEFGEHFGVHDSDLENIKSWLSSQGLTVERVTKAKRAIIFSGNVGQIEQAFQTEIHHFLMPNGEMHVSNNRDISIPEALNPVVAGVPTLNNFFRKAHHTPFKRLSEMRKRPNYSNGANCGSVANSDCFVGPADFATIYNTNPLLAQGITGQGVTIGIVGRSDILMSDVQTYRQLFNLPVNDPVFIHAGQDNGIEAGDDGESDLDVEISGGVAPGATVDFVIGTPTFLVDGITNSIEYLVENNIADIISSSYGDCEGNEGAGGNQFNQQMFEQAAAQGTSVFIADGDNGAAECDDSNDSYEVLGYAASAEASTPYTVSVGGTEFDEGSNTGYWTNTNNPVFQNSAVSYIPEYPWNEAKSASPTSSPSGDLAGLWSGSGGISAYYLQPPWQMGSGVPSTDPVLTQGGDWLVVTVTNPGSGYTSAPSVTFAGETCVSNPVAASTTLSGGSVASVVYNDGTQGGTLHTGQGFGCTVPGTVTFTAAPAGGTTATGTVALAQMQNVLPLITGVPHRYTPDVSLNAASGHDATFFCSEGVCEISSTGVLEDAGLVGGTSVAAPSMAGIQALIDQANGGRQGMPAYQYYTLANNQYVNNPATCNSSTPPANGSNCAFQDITTGNNYICGASTCTTTAAKMGFAAGTGYDMATGLGSPNAANLSSQWSSVVFNSSNTTLNLSQTTFAEGTSISLSGTVASGAGTPTGDVAFIVSSGAIGDTNNQVTGAQNGPVAFATLSGGAYSATLNNLPGGTYYVTARYGGDDNFASSLSAGVQVTVSQGGSGVSITPYALNGTACTITTGSSFAYASDILLNIAVAPTSGGGAPTGAVSITDNGNPLLTSQTLDPNGDAYILSGTIATSSCVYEYSFSNVPTLTVGTHNLVVNYSGDNSYSASSASTTITVTQATPTLTLATGAANITSGFNVPLTATFGGLTALNGSGTGNAAPTGTVTFKDTTTSTTLGTAPVVSTALPVTNAQTVTYTAVAGPFSTTGITTSGANSITATYSGDTNWAPVTSAAVTVTVGTYTNSTAITVSNAGTGTAGNPASLGGRPTFTATITGSPAAPTSGTVTFYDTTTTNNYQGSPAGTYVLGTGTVGSTHTATFRLASATEFGGGTHSITATYGGVASTFAPSTTASAYVETVTQGTVTNVLSAKTVGKSGQNYYFTSVITPSSTSTAYQPNAQVQFFDACANCSPSYGTTSLGTASLYSISSGNGGYAIYEANLSTNSLAVGTHTITATYLGDVNYPATTSNVQTVFAGGTPSLTWATPAPIAYGTTLSATQLNASDTVPGTFVYTPAVGTVLSPGPHTLSVTFTPADYTDFGPQTTTVPLTVNPAATSINVTSVSPASETYGQDAPVTITAVLSWTGAGSAPTASAVTIGGNGPSGYSATSCGAPSGDTITCTATYTPTVADNVGSYTESASFAGDSNYSGSGSAQNNNFTIGIASSTTVVTSSQNPSTYAQPVTFTATINGQNNLVKGKAKKPLDVTGTVTWSSNTGCGTTAVTSGNPGTATCTTSRASSLEVGTDTVTATYNGDNNHAGSTGSVNQIVQGGIATSINVTSVSPGAEDYGADTPVTITAVLSWVGNGVAPTASDVTIGGNGNGTYGATSCAARVHETITCTATYTPTAADTPTSYTETATFTGDINYGSSSSPQTNNFTINGSTSTTTVTSTPNPSVYATSVTFTATITGENGNVKGGARKKGVKPQIIGGTVTWSTNTGCGTTNVTTGYPGIATCTTSSATHLPVGADTVTATYSGDSNHGGSTGSVVQNVTGGIATSISVTNVSPASETYGQDAATTITAVLSWTGNGVAPTASDVTIGGNGNGTYGATSCAARVHETITCTATYTPTAADTVASYTETATFAGDTNYASSSSTQTNNFAISQASQTVTFTTPAPPTAKSGDAFTVVATGGASGNPVTFTVGAGSACTLAGATYTMTSNTGHCYVVANQAGNSNYAAAAQVTETVTAVKKVTKIAPTVTFTGAPANAPYLSTFTLATTQNSGVTPTFSSTNRVICTVSGNVVTMIIGTGTCTVKATWATNDYYLGTSLTQSTTATKLNTTTAITGTATLTPSNHKKVTVYFGVTNGVNAVAGDVTVTASSGETCTGTVLAGKCAVTFAASGSKTLTAVYTGNPNNNASTSASYPLTVN
ncbi:MAG: Ig-like domain repeat protein [Terriglobales bacterium]